MAIYASVLGHVLPNALGTILVASVISTPAALSVAALMIPFAPVRGEQAGLQYERPTGVLDAVTRGTAEGVAPLVGIASTLLVTVALVALPTPRSGGCRTTRHRPPFRAGSACCSSRWSG